MKQTLSIRNICINVFIESWFYFRCKTVHVYRSKLRIQVHIWFLEIKFIYFGLYFVVPIFYKSIFIRFIGTISVKYCMIKICLINNSILLFVIPCGFKFEVDKVKETNENWAYINSNDFTNACFLELDSEWSNVPSKLSPCEIHFLIIFVKQVPQKIKTLMLIYLKWMHVYCSMFTLFFLIWFEFNLKISLHHILLVLQIARKLIIYNRELILCYSSEYIANYWHT